MVRLLVLLTLAAVSALSQTKAPRPPQKKTPAKAAAAAPTRWPIQSLAVEGNRRYTREQVLAVAGLKVGDLAGREEFEAAHDRLKASGAFDTVGYKFIPGANGKGYAATFQVTELEPVLPVRFEDLGLPDADIEKTLRQRDPLFSMSQITAAWPVIDRYAKWIEERLASAGKPEKIAATVDSEPEPRAVVFRPARALPAVAEVSFSGAAAIGEDKLREAVAGPAVGAPYREDRFRGILDSSVRPLYEARGQVRVAFSEIRTEPATDVKGLRVSVTVKEGDVFKLGKIEFDGVSPVRPAVLLKAGAFDSGELANFDKVAAGLVKMRALLRREGYLDGKVVPERTIRDAEKLVDLKLRVEPGSQYAMGKLSIEGLDLTGEAEIRRMWNLKEGRPFDVEYPDRFLQFVREQGLFDNLGATKADARPDEGTRRVSVTLTFGGAGEAVGRRRRAP